MPDSNILKLKAVKINDRLQYFDYLLLADGSETAIKSYINDGDLYTIHCEYKTAGVVLLTYHSNQVAELKNIALGIEFRGKGIGKIVVTELFEICKRKGISKIIVGTANSSIGNLAFYQKVGFRMMEIKRDFFKDYPETIFEDGIRALDMVMFEKRLIE